jgi:hypothetical protein
MNDISVITIFSNIPLPENEENFRHYNRYKKFIESRPSRPIRFSKSNKKYYADASFNIHHIFPKSMGGLDIKENLIKLTPREEKLRSKDKKTKSWKAKSKEELQEIANKRAKARQDKKANNG